MIIQGSKDLVKLNNAAVRHMEGGDFQSAGLLLKLALSLVAKSGKKRGDAAAFTTVKSKFAWSTEIPTHKLDLLGPGKRFEFGIFLFAKGILITSTAVSRESKAAILYNAALVAHLLAVWGPIHGHSALLRRAKKLYNLSRILLKQCPKSMLLHKLFIHMAILNNLGHLSYGLVDYECCRLYFGFLYKTINCGETACTVAFDQRDIQGMAGNSVFVTPTAAPCA